MERDKRKRERSPINQLIVLSTSDGSKINAEGVNISESGMLCRAEKEIPVGTFLLFDLTIKNGKSSMNVGLEGIVIKCSREGGRYNIVIDFTS